MLYSWCNKVRIMYYRVCIIIQWNTVEGFNFTNVEIVLLFTPCVGCVCVWNTVEGFNFTNVELVLYFTSWGCGGRVGYGRF